MAGIEEANADLLRSCGLPDAWAAKSQWRILGVGPGAASLFLRAWRAWREDADRPRLLHFVALCPAPCSALELVAGAGHHTELRSLAQELSSQWFGLMPGAHRLAFEDGRVLLTLHVHEPNKVLRRETFVADSVMLDHLEAGNVKAISRHCVRGSKLAAMGASREALRELEQCGFAMAPGGSRGVSVRVFAPAWEPKQRGVGLRADPTAHSPFALSLSKGLHDADRASTSSARTGRVPGPASETSPSIAMNCIVIGAGLAGAAVAASLARRGWDVRVYDAADRPAVGASGVPVAMLAPHFSPDDGLLSRLARAGVRMTLQQARQQLVEGEDFFATGVLELREPVLHDFTEGEYAWSRPATDGQTSCVAGAPAASALWHEQAAWVKPGALVKAWISQPGITWQGNTSVSRCVRDATDEHWLVLDAEGNELGRATLVVIAAAHASAALAGIELPLIPVRGQISFGTNTDAGLPPFPLNGNGHFIPVQAKGVTNWFCGSTFDRDESSLDVREADHDANLARLRELLPSAAAAVEHEFATNTVRAWTGVRCASSNRRPLVGQLKPGLWLSTAMGSRGLTFCTLSAELLAAQLHDEPLPIETKLASALAPKTEFAARPSR